MSQGFPYTQSNSMMVFKSPSKSPKYIENDAIHHQSEVIFHAGSKSPAVNIINSDIDEDCCEGDFSDGNKNGHMRNTSTVLRSSISSTGS